MTITKKQFPSADQLNSYDFHQYNRRVAGILGVNTAIFLSELKAQRDYFQRTESMKIFDEVKPEDEIDKYVEEVRQHQNHNLNKKWEKEQKTILTNGYAMLCDIFSSVQPGMVILAKLDLLSLLTHYILLL